MKSFWSLVAVAAWMTFGGGLAQAAIDVTVDHGAVWQTKQAGDNTEGFFDIHNDGDSADVLTALDCSDADTTSLVDANGKVLKTLTIQPGQVVSLSQQGPHVVLLDTHFKVDFGSVLPCSFTFQNAGDIAGYLNAVPAPTAP
jgi:copper(I)-binding protein